MRMKIERISDVNLIDWMGLVKFTSNQVGREFRQKMEERMRMKIHIQS